MNTLKNIVNQVWCLCAAEEKPQSSVSPASGSLWQWYRARNAALAERGAEVAPERAQSWKLKVGSWRY